MKIFWVLVLFCAQSLSAAEGCLAEHIREGIHLNESRKQHYSDMSGGASVPVSEMLINSEYNMIFLLKLVGYEKKAAGLHQQGVMFFCDEFKSTANIMSIDLQEDKPNIKDFDPISFSNTRAKYKQLLKQKSLVGFYQETVRDIEKLLIEPRFNCMTRHILESLGRIAWLALQDSRKELLARDLLGKMLWSFYTSKQLDVMAAPLQAQGVPILCHDLPAIQFK